MAETQPRLQPGFAENCQRSFPRASLNRHIASYRQMVRHIRLRYDWLSHHDILTEEIVKRRVREPVSAGMRDPLLEGNCVKHAAKRASAQSVECLLCGEYRLIVPFCCGPSRL